MEWKSMAGLKSRMKGLPSGGPGDHTDPWSLNSEGAR